MAVPAADLKKLARTRHIIYLLVAATVILPYLFNWTQEDFEPDDNTTDLFKKVDSLAPGTPVLISFDDDPGAEAELTPMGVALLRHCFKKDLIPVAMTHMPTGVDLARSTLTGAVNESERLWGKKKVSGVDYVFLGFRPGLVNLIIRMGGSVKGAFPSDGYGKPTADMPALRNLASLKDLELMVCLSSSNTVDTWLAYGADRYKFPYGAGVTAVMVPDLYPVLQTGQMLGMMGGLRGAADYETLLKRSDPENKELMSAKARGTLGMTAQSATHLLIIIVVLAVNVRYLFRKLTGREKG